MTAGSPTSTCVNSDGETGIQRNARPSETEPAAVSVLTHAFSTALERSRTEQSFIGETNGVSNLRKNEQQGDVNACGLAECFHLEGIR